MGPAAKLTRRVVALVVCCSTAAALGACGDRDPDLVAGKQMFVKRCGSCHVLNRAATTGTRGPNLDTAFARALSEGFGRSAIRGVVHSQILYPADLPKDSPAYMPPRLVTGDDAHNVAAYVARAAARGGKDAGLLATAVQAAGAGKPIAAKGGKLEIPADPNGQLAYITKKATAEAGKLEVSSKNESSVDHDIAIEGGGLDEKGAVVKNGGTSRFTVTVKPGEYKFYCTVPGHREGGMEGVLTVK